MKSIVFVLFYVLMHAQSASSNEDLLSDSLVRSHRQLLSDLKKELQKASLELRKAYRKSNIKKQDVQKLKQIERQLEALATK